MAWAQGVGFVAGAAGKGQEINEEVRRYKYDAQTLMREAELMQMEVKEGFRQDRANQFMATREAGYQFGSMEATGSTTGVSGGSSTSAMRRAESRFREGNKMYGQQASFKRDIGLKKAEELRKHSRELGRRADWRRKQGYFEMASYIFGSGSETMASGMGGK